MNTHTTISAFDAKNRLGQLLDKVEGGEEMVITRHGKPVARLVPIPAKDANGKLIGALDTFRQVRKSLAKSGKKISRDEIIGWRNEGRK